MKTDIILIRRILSVFLIILIAYLLKVLSFVFIPLIFAVFLTLLFLPALRWLRLKGIAPWAGIIFITMSCSVLFLGIYFIIQETIQELVANKEMLISQFNNRLFESLVQIDRMAGTELAKQKSTLLADFVKSLFSSGTFSLISNTISSILITILFVFLMLGGVLNYRNHVREVSAIGDNQFRNLKVFDQIVSSCSTFLKVKTLISIATGLFFTIICYIFEVNFPLFWGFLAFAINYVQMVGSIVSIVLVALFGFIQIDSLPLFWLFTSLLIGTQVLFGSILEPIFMGKTFSINTVMIIVSLMIWGYIWGVPGLILSIPIVTLMKIILDSTDEYKILKLLVNKR